MTHGSIDSDVSDTPGALPVGAKIGKYEIVQRLGTGGQSIVYKAYDALLDRHVAIKQVAPHLAADEKFLPRFREVVRQLAKLDCEEVVTIHDLIEDRAGVFIVMEFVEGHTLETMLSSSPGPAEVKAALQIIWRIAAGLAAIHKTGIIHRDLKPGNIIIGEGLRVKITDFGVAARAGAPVSMRLGTTKYMAPELFAGERVDGRADIYSLGMIAYEMLVGRGKFNEIFHEIVRDRHSEALRWMKWHSSPDQTAPPLDEANPTVPPALAAIVGKMLEKDPDRRYPDVEALGREIRASFSPKAQAQRAAGGAPRLSVEAAAQAEAGAATVGQPEATASGPEAAEGEPPTAELPREPMSLRKKLTLAAVAGGILLIVLAGVLIHLGARQAERRKRAEIAYSNAVELYNKAAKGETSQQRRAGFQAALKAFREIAASQQFSRLPVARQAYVKGTLCRAQLAVLDADWNETYDCSRMAEKALNDIEREYEDLGDWVKRARQELGDFEEYVGYQRMYVDAMRDVDSAMTAGDLEAAQAALDKAAEAARFLHREQRDRVLSIRRDVDEKKQQREFWAQVKDGDAQARKGDYAAAQSAYDRALSVLQSSQRKLSPKLLSDLRRTVELKKADLERERKYKQALVKAQSLEKSDKLAAAEAYEQAARIKPTEAGALMKKVQSLRYRHWMEEGQVALKAGRIEDAEKAFNSAKSVQETPAVAAALRSVRNLRDHHALVAQGDRLFFRQKNYDGALEKYREAQKLLRDPGVAKKITDCRYFIKLAEADGLRGKAQWDQARRAYEQAKRIKPAASAEVDQRLLLLEKDRKYAMHVTAGKEAWKKHDWSGAVAQFKQAQQEKDTPEVRDLISRVRYEQYVTLGREALDEESYNSALGYFKQAERLLATDEIKALIRQVKKALEQGSESGT